MNYLSPFIFQNFRFPVGFVNCFLSNLNNSWKTVKANLLTKIEIIVEDKWVETILMTVGTRITGDGKKIS
ncbi:MAG: hypothetical protein RMI79_04925 [Nitrososphaerota archaeon]|nr:hypothetical protein [Nitrososphaerota archaeon]